MNSTATPATKPTPEFPSLWEFHTSDNHFVVLMYTESYGTVVHVVKSLAWNVGEHSDEWNMSTEFWSPYRGKITLEN